MKILLLGKTGLLGKAILSAFEGHHNVTATEHTECDVTDVNSIEHWVSEISPELVINATGYTAVDRAEEERDRAFCVNADGVGNLCKILAPKNIPLIHFSTDYVFDGEKKEGYGECDSPSPVSVYGASKAGGESEIQKNLVNFYLIRTAWLFGPGGKNFVDTMLSMVEEGRERILKIVNDQMGNPTYTADLAQAVLRLLNGAPYGIYHIVNTGDCSWYDFASEIFHQLGLPQKIIPITSKELNRAAVRPHYSILRSTKLPPLRHWKEALADYLQNKALIL